MRGVHIEWSKVSSTADWIDSFMPRYLRRLGKQQRWGLLTHGLTPPLATLGSDYPPLLCTLPILKQKRTES